MTHLFGRDHELSFLDGFLAAQEAGPRALVIAGEAGIGRSTVWAEGVRLARERGWGVLSCRPGRTETALAYSALADALEPALEPVLDRLPPVQRHALEVMLLRREPAGTYPDPRSIGAAALSMVRLLAADRPMMIAIDDAELLDPGTAEVFGYVLRRLHTERVALLATVRADADGTPAQALADHRISRLRLGPLDLSALGRLVRARTGVPMARPILRRLRQASGGNPYLMLELARAASGTPAGGEPGEPLPIPRAVAESLSQQIDPLPGPTREALLYAATLAEPTLGLVRAVLRTPADQPSALVPAEEHGVITVDGGRIRFTHPLLASAIYAAAPAEHRQLAHRRLARAVTDPERRIWHLGLASDGTDERLAAQLEGAAEAAQHRATSASVAQLWQLATGRTPAHQAHEARRRAVAAARCVFAAGDTARSRDLLEAAVDAMPPGRERAAALSDLARIVYADSGPREATELCRRALAEPSGSGPQRAALHLCTAVVATHDASLQLRSALTALLLLKREGPAAAPELLAGALVATATYRFANGGPIAWDALTRATDLLRRANRRSWVRDWAEQALGSWARHHDPHAARDRFADAYRRGRDRGDEVAVSHSLTKLSEVDCQLGDWHRAEEEADDAIELIEQTGQREWLAFGLHARTLVAAHRGAYDVVSATAQRGLRLADAANDPYAGVLHRQVLGFAELTRGDYEAADHHLSIAADLVEGMGFRQPAGFTCYSDRIEVAVALDRPDLAARLSTWLSERAAAAPGPWLVALAARAEAVVRQMAGDLESAGAAVDRSIRAWRRLGMPFELGRALLIQGRIRRAGRQKRAAGDSLVKSREIFERLGAPPWAEQASAELRRCGLRRVRADELSPTEERVATLVAAGLSNREVAAAAYISVKTVEANLSRIYRKVGVQNRRELARILGSAKY